MSSVEMDAPTDKPLYCFGEALTGFTTIPSEIPKLVLSQETDSAKRVRVFGSSSPLTSIQLWEALPQAARCHVPLRGLPGEQRRRPAD